MTGKPQKNSLERCPFCSGGSVIRYGRNVGTGAFRRHKCKECGRQFSSTSKIHGVEGAQKWVISVSSLVKALELAGFALDWTDLDIPE